MKSIQFLSVLAAVCLFANQANAISPTIGTYNLILKEDLTSTNEIGGRIHVGGSIKGTTFQVGFSLPSSPGVDAVTVVNDINANEIHVHNGHNTVYGGSLISAKIDNQGGGTISQKDKALLQSESDALYAQVIAESNFYNNSAANGSYTYTEGKIITLNPSNSGLTVIELDASLLNNSNGEIKFSSIPTTPVVINVIGSGAVNILAKAVGNLAGDALASLVAWNFNLASSINFGGDGWVGSVLAPFADITSGKGGHIEGSVAAKSLTLDIELHNSLFSYTPPVTPPKEVPAPPMLFLMLLSLGWIVHRKVRGI